MAEQEQNRSEPATPFKLKEARRRGSVAKSLELQSLFALLALLVVVYLRGLPMAQQQLRLDAGLLEQAHQLSFDVAVLGRWLPALLAAALDLVLPLFVLIVVVAILGTLLQTGPVFSTHALKPDLDRINPVSGFKRLFSMRLLFELGKNLVKLVLFGGAIWLLLQSLLPELMALLFTDPVAYLRLSHDWIIGVIWKLTLVLAFIALIDAMYTRWSFADKLKMSMRELKDETKQREGDPHVRARIRELQRELVKRAKAIKRLPDADVLITNPTHLAVALAYRREDMQAPQLIAKGAGEFAAHMRTLAQRHRVPVIENAALARELFAAVEIDKAVPERLYAPVARVLVRAYALRAQQRQQPPRQHQRQEQRA
jgi:flagellar biosynthesis protein FlhB